MLCNWSYKWSWRARSNSIENESVFPLKSSRVTFKIHFAGRCLASLNSCSFCVAVFICFFWPLIRKWNHQLLNLAPCSPLPCKFKGRAVLQAMNSRPTPKATQVHLGSLALGWRDCRLEPCCLWWRSQILKFCPFGKSCKPLPLAFYGWRGVIFSLVRWNERQSKSREQADSENLRYFCHKKHCHLELYC